MRYIHHGKLKPCVATIGNFDGMHVGHVAMLKMVQAQAQTLQLASAVIVFEPQPAEYFQSNPAPGRLMRLRDKLEFLRALGLDQVCCVRFDEQVATLSAADFIQRYLIERWSVRQLIIGEDFRFGHQRQGDVALLQQSSAFQVTPFPAYCLDGIRVSSSAIRQALHGDDFSQAQQYLGRAFTLQGKVIPGDQRGRLLQFPTANMALHRRTTPLKGVYAVRIYGVPQQEVLFGVANIGHRPTVGDQQCLLEVHIFDFNQPLYGLRLSIEFCHKIREQQAFASLSALQQQIHLDCQVARNFFC